MATKRSAVVTAVIGLTMVLLTACGQAAAPLAEGAAHAEAEAQRIEVVAKDIEFAPEQITVKEGQPVTVVLDNQGALEHDWTVAEIEVAGDVHSETEGASDEHEGEGAHGDEEPALHVAALGGNRGEVTFTPAHAGTYEYVCTVAGHKEAGMVGMLVVE